MSRVPCKKCSSCGFFHDLSVPVCDVCGTDLKNIPALMVETDDIPGKLYGEIDEKADVYVQKCSVCGTLNFTSDENSPVTRCHNCHKPRIASIKPVEYSCGAEDEEAFENSGSESVLKTNSEGASASKISVKSAVLFDDDDDDDDDDGDGAPSPWSGMLGNIKKSVGNTDTSDKNIPSSPKNTSPVSASTADYDDEDDEDDDDAVSGWSGVLGEKEKTKPAASTVRKADITLSAIRYGRLTFTVEADPNKPYLLGRSANQADFLSADGRVGNAHCYLIFRDGYWYVKDNHSSNGTAVNSVDIGYNGERMLSDGDELKLGHHNDSMAFKITIK